MSKPRYDWWPYVKGMLRRWPELSIMHADIHSVSVTVQVAGGIKSPNPGRNTEAAAIREMPKIKQREYDAVRQAIDITEHYKDGRDRIKMIRLVFWDKTHTLQGAAQETHISMPTAKRWHGEFIRLTARYFGLME